MFVGSKGGNFGDKATGYSAPTASSSSKNSRPSTTVDDKAESDEKDQ